tara:strand:+ start:952 stop:1167 length:216 start_codon:yes stop_codon:yes gene_type:complete
MNLITEYKNLKNWDRGLCLDWLVFNDKQNGINSNKRSYMQQGIKTLKMEIVSRSKLELSPNTIYKQFKKPN